MSVINSSDDAIDHEEEDLDVFETTQSQSESSQDSLLTKLPSSMLLTVADADSFLRWRDATIIAVIGERNGGKTTLLTEIYNQFLRGSYADTSFCHSRTLLGFEEKSFPSRADSRLTRPDTPRTSVQDGLRFFHLAVLDKIDFKRRDLLITERAGETYREVRDNPESAEELLEIRKAAYIVFILDGERVADFRRRAEAFSSVRGMIKSVIETQNIENKIEIQLVTTKCDLFESDQKHRIILALETFEQQLAEMLSVKCNFKAHRTIARNPKLGVRTTEGLDVLLRSWLNMAKPKLKSEINVPLLESEFDKLFFRRESK
ncbi:GTPase domain-containing protein [Shewanella septentrionalis]|uniref:GTPase domain-containing protein n=1 Tax=Shewanella septentrionalis TaxID=2952223 RepID=A0A9X2WYP0_9GAMM|nr:GTPase domain-containing protein [Shewanella septentrionalis]MCT7947813.1 GTPase domain-containing protein [Shewanella septentrionalis]